MRINKEESRNAYCESIRNSRQLETPSDELPMKISGNQISRLSPPIYWKVHRRLQR